MPKKIEPNLRKIGEYLKIAPNEVFVIPEYQRPYSWTITECDKLWQDIETFMEACTGDDCGGQEPYFFGTVIADCSAQDSEHEIHLIDGQQRTTTFILLLKALLLKIEKILAQLDAIRDEDSETLCEGLKEKRGKIIDILGKTNVDHRRGEFLKDWSKMAGIKLLISQSINELNEFKPELQRIVEAKDIAEAERNCYKIPRKRRDNRYTNFYRNFNFFITKLSGCSDSHVNAFAKTFLEMCQIIEIRSWDTEQAITMFNSLNSTGMPLSDSDIISAQLYSNSAGDRDTFVARWEAITQLADRLASRKIASIDSLLQQLMYIIRAERRVYVHEGQQPDVRTPGLRRYYTIDEKSLLKQPMVLCERIEKIALTWDAVADNPRVKLLLKFNENAKLFLISFLNRFEVDELSEAPVAPIVECLLKLFAILEVVDAGYSSAKFKTFLFGENVKLVDKTVPLEEIQRDFSEHILRYWKPKDIQESISEYEKNSLVFLNDFLFAKLHGHADDFNFSELVNIEHIMPGSGHNLDAIRQDAGISTREDFTNLVNKLGNKILLEEDINKSISNDWFKTKKQKSVKEKRGYKDSSYSLAQALTSYPSDTWTKTDIERATEKAAQRICDFIFAK